MDGRVAKEWLLACQTVMKDLKEQLGALYAVQTPKGIIGVIPLTFGRARITIGSDVFTYDDGW
jgi:hypothetical protein